MGTRYEAMIEGATVWERIGDEGLEGIAGDFITIRGPCGDSHTMSKRAAAQLRDWLDETLGGPPTIVMRRK